MKISTFIFKTLPPYHYEIICMLIKYSKCSTATKNSNFYVSEGITAEKYSQNFR